MSVYRSLRRSAASQLRAWTWPLVTMRPIENCPGWLGRLHKLNVPGNVEPNEQESPAGASNIRIIFRLLEPALALEGDYAECGVWHGSTLISVGLFVQHRASGKRVLGFDSFQGLSNSVSRDVALGGVGDPNKRVGGFSDTSYEAVRSQVERFRLPETVTLVPGYFQDTLHKHADARFCFVHLDCVLYDSYRQCLEFFYPRVSRGGIILLDEYRDPPWPGCTQAVDEFLVGKPEKIQEIKSDNHIKYFLRKL